MRGLGVFFKINILFLVVCASLGCMVSGDFGTIDQGASEQGSSKLTVTGLAIVTGANVNAFPISGTCTDKSGTITVKVNTNSTFSVVCTNDSFSQNLDLTAADEGALAFVFESGSNSVKESTTKDTVAPTAPSSIVDGSASASLTQTPTITYTASTDSGSGVLKYQIQLVRISDSMVMKAWSDHVSGQAVTGLTLANGASYRVDLRATDNANNTSAISSSDGWTIVTSGPNLTGAAFTDGTSSTTAQSPAFTWNSATDNGAGVSNYQIAIGTKIGRTDTLPWTSTGLVNTYTATGLSLISGGYYFASLRAIDSLGNISTVNGDGWLVTAPSVTISVRSSATNSGGTGFGTQTVYGIPTFWDIYITSSTHSILANGQLDAYDLDAVSTITLAPTTHASLAYSGNTNLAFVQAGLGAVTQNVSDQINWIVSQNFTSDSKYAGRFSYGEVQWAIWRLMGHSNATISLTDIRWLNDNNRTTVTSGDYDFILSAASSAVSSGLDVVPYDQFFSAIASPTGGSTDQFIQVYSGKIGDTVWSDSNANGIQDGGELGVNGITVELYNGSNVLLASTKTGDDFGTTATETGYYQFTGLKAGTYKIKFIPGAYQFTSQAAGGGSQPTVDSDADTTTGFSGTITLTAGQTVQSIDAGLVP